MPCKHSDVIAIKANAEKEYFCTLFKKRIKDYECSKCMMKIEENPCSELLGRIFGKGFEK